MGVSHELLIRTEVKQPAGGVIRASGKCIAIWKELERESKSRVCKGTKNKHWKYHCPRAGRRLRADSSWGPHHRDPGSTRGHRGHRSHGSHRTPRAGTTEACFSAATSSQASPWRKAGKASPSGTGTWRREAPPAEAARGGSCCTLCAPRPLKPRAGGQPSTERAGPRGQTAPLSDVLQGVLSKLSCICRENRERLTLKTSNTEREFCGCSNQSNAALAKDLPRGSHSHRWR